MSVYVDEARYPFGRMLMAHMIADTPAELREMVLAIGLDTRHFQRSASAPHFDVCKSKRAQAIALGAIPVDRRTFVEHVRRVRLNWPRTPLGNWYWIQE